MSRKSSLPFQPLTVLLALAVPLAGCFLYRPAMRLNGIVSDARTGKAVAGARIRVGEYVTYSATTGTYQMKVRRESRATAEVSAPGYRTSTVKCEATTKRPVCDVPLTPD